MLLVEQLPLIELQTNLNLQISFLLYINDEQWSVTVTFVLLTHQVASGMILVMAFFLITYTFHSTWVTSEAYSSPSIVLSARGGDGSRIIFDDFREAYYWLRHNTPEVRHKTQQASQNKVATIVVGT